MNTLEGIIEDVNKSKLVSDKVIKKVRELIGQEEWNDLYDEENDVITTTGELLITLESIKELQEENEYLNNLVKEKEQRGLEIQEDLSKEKADLITRIEHTRCDAIELLNNERKRLTEAKEIIKLLLWDLRNRSYEPVKDLERAEQFLKELEK